MPFGFENEAIYLTLQSKVISSALESRLSHTMCRFRYNSYGERKRHLLEGGIKPTTCLDFLITLADSVWSFRAMRR